MRASHSSSEIDTTVDTDRSHWRGRLHLALVYQKIWLGLLSFVCALNHFATIAILSTLRHANCLDLILRGVGGDRHTDNDNVGAAELIRGYVAWAIGASGTKTRILVSDSDCTTTERSRPSTVSVESYAIAAPSPSPPRKTRVRPVRRCSVNNSGSAYCHCFIRSGRKKRVITMAPGSVAHTMLEDKEKVLCSSKVLRTPALGRPRVNQFAPLLIALVGLPARGKSQLAHRLARHLNWNGESTKVFDCSEYRRRHMEMYASHDIFREDNLQGSAIRKQSAQEAVQDAVLWLKDGNSVAIFDGTNITRQQRHEVHQHCVCNLGFRILFIECVCEDQDLLERNIIEILRYSADYKNMSDSQSVDDLRKKLQHYMRQYQPIDSDMEEISFVRVENGGETVVAHKVNGQKESGILGYLSGMKPMPQTLYFSRHGESEYNVLGKIGGDADLSPRGFQYAHALSKHLNELATDAAEQLEVWTSELRRTKQTAQNISAPQQSIRALNELDAGICEGLTYEEMQQRFPQEFAWRDQDKLRYRYPWGESYIDIMTRLRPVLGALEDSDRVVLVGHQAVLRCVLGYFLDAKLDEVPYMNVPLHTVVKLSSEGYKYRAEMIDLGVECVDTHRKQPKNCSISRTSDDALVTVPSHYDTLPSSLWQTTPTAAL